MNWLSAKRLMWKFLSDCHLLIDFVNDPFSFILYGDGLLYLFAFELQINYMNYHIRHNRNSVPLLFLE